jgi:hypothetical protein
MRRKKRSTTDFYIADAQSVTDAEWAAINALRRSFEAGGSKALSEAFKKLSEDSVLYIGVVGAFFPDMVREMLLDEMAAQGITQEDIEEVIRKRERLARLQ